MRSFLFFSYILLLFFTLLTPVAAHGSVQNDNPLVIELTADGPLTPAMAEYIKRGIRIAEERGAQALIFQLNTPGGSLTLMNRMLQTIRSSHVPVIIYVAPRGAMAGSAGALITLAGHAAAMAPETAIGAASPVGSQGEDLDQTSQAKEKNILKATVRSLTEDRGQAATQAAEEMIETASALSAREALDVGLVDYMAADVNDLLHQLNGAELETIDGLRILNTSNADVTSLPSSFIEQLLALLTNPNIVFLLLSIGVQAVLIELSSPGGWIAGFIGAICLALAAFGLGVLDVNWFGAIFLIIAFVLFILDIKAPTHGALTAAGVACLIVGALVLFNSPRLPAFQPRLSIPLVVGVSLATGAIFFTFLLFAVRAQKAPIRMGAETLGGRTGVARSTITSHSPGLVQLAGEEWTAELAEGEEPITNGARVLVVRVEGLRLIVRRAE
jgi:membrane-bound serine protease (ClpP class)